MFDSTMKRYNIWVGPSLFTRGGTSNKTFKFKNAILDIAFWAKPI